MTTTDRMEIIVESKNDFATTVSKLKEAVAEVGFSVQFELDIQQRVGDKGFDLPPTYLVGVCNAKFAYQSLTGDVRILPNLPCRIAVYERDGKVYLSTLDVKQIGSMYEGDALPGLMTDVDAAVHRMMTAASS